MEGINILKGSFSMVTIKTIKNYDDENGNSIVVGHGVVYKSSTIVFNEKNSSISIGDRCILNCHIILGNNSHISIGEDSIINGRISIGAWSSVVIGRELNVTSNLTIRAVENTRILIGDNCLFASNIIIRSNDGHPIYDTKTHKRLNLSKGIIIGKHVWLADEVAVLKGVKIGDGSIIAMRSVVTKNIPEKCIAAGIPAKVIKKGCTWEHSTSLHSAEFYDLIPTM